MRMFSEKDRKKDDKKGEIDRKKDEKKPATAAQPKKEAKSEKPTAAITPRTPRTAR